MAIVPHSVARGAVLGVQRLTQTVNIAATGDVYIPLLGKFRIVAVAIVPLVDQSSFTGVTAQLFAPDGTTALTDALAIDEDAGYQVDGDAIAPDNNIVDAQSEPLILTVTNAGSDTLKFQILVLYSNSLSSDAGQYTDYFLPVF
jgi:hypothetical protein